MMEPPYLPYNDPEPSSGHSGSETSAARAKKRDSTGRTARTQTRLLTMLASAARRGVTVAEARDVMTQHHGSISGALSNMHKVGVISRLAETRNGCKVYVLPEHVAFRKTESQGWK